MAIKSYVNGAGGTTGADLAILDRTELSGNYWYVGNAVPGASDSNTGLNRGAPLLTTAQAYSNASAGDVIVYLASHNETIPVAVTLGKAGLSLVGEGAGASVPRFTCGAAIVMFDITTAGTLMDNLYMASPTAAPTACVRVGAAGSVLNALQFDCNSNITTHALTYVTGAATGRLTNSRFTSVGATPNGAIQITDAMSDLTIDEVTLDGGSSSWTSFALNGGAAIARLRATNLNLLNGSHVSLPTGTTGVIQVEVATGNSRVSWTV